MIFKDLQHVNIATTQVMMTEVSFVQVQVE